MDEDKNIRNTKQRKMLLQLLCSTDSHPNAFWLYDRLKPEFPNISLSTVYRNLGILEKQGMLLRLPCISYDRYDGNTEMHTHFLCRSCEKVYDLDTEGVERQILGSFEGKHDVKGCNIIFHGVCEECKSNKKLKYNEEGN
jgi:Fur family transcriptional regulator, peroxide stress response regulator